MKYKRFEDTPVWQQAADLAAAMFEWTTEPSFKAKGISRINCSVPHFPSPTTSLKVLSVERRETSKIRAAETPGYLSSGACGKNERDRSEDTIAAFQKHRRVRTNQSLPG